MKLIYMQDTINYMHKLNPSSLKELEQLGAPEVVDLERETPIKYYMYEL